jgi:esterase/lipase superfamily enzyme
MKTIDGWHSERLGSDVRLVRWGEFGVPVLIFPTAGGDAEEIERFGLVGALSGLLGAGRIKVYSVDSIAGRSLLEKRDTAHTAWLFNAFSTVISEEFVPAIRMDCSDNDIEIVSAGASIGAFNAVSALCRHPHLFRLAVGMSGTYDLSDSFGGGFTDDFYFTSPLHYLPALEGPQLDQMRRRFVVLATGSGAWEDPGQTWEMAKVLGARGIPNRVDVWSEDHRHDWVTWREMLPLYLDDLV